MTDLFTSASEAREAGIAQASFNAPRDWKIDVLEVIDAVSRLNLVFTADDVWARLETHGARDIDIANPAALGPVMRQAAKAGMIRKTGRYVPSRLARRHRDLVEWERA
jgi:hypothetical protein